MAGRSVAIHLGLGLVRQRVLLDRLTASVFVALGLKLTLDSQVG